MTNLGPAAQRRVFLSFAHDDQALAQGIEEALAQSGVRTTSQVLQAAPGGDLTAGLRDMVRANDVVVLLLSPAEATLHQADDEIAVALSRDLARRGAELIPVLAVPTDPRPVLSSLAVVDLTDNAPAGLRQLVDQIQAVSRTDFSTLSPRTFENLVADLLQASGFVVDERRPYPDQGADLRATYQRFDPFGMPETEVWLVETKLYSSERVSVQTIRQLAGIIAMAPAGTRGLLVTNAQLTSVAQELVAELEQRTRIQLRVLDGVELRRLLRQFPAIAARYFGDSTAEPGSDGDS